MRAVNAARSISLALMLSLGCLTAAAQKVKTDFDKSIDFSQFHKYSWRESPLFEKHPELQQQFSVAIDLIRSEVNRDLGTKGFLRTDASPDFYITLFIAARGMQDIDTVSTGGWYGWGGFWHPGWAEVMVSSYARGTLVLDFVDAPSTQLAWRAYCQDDIRDMKSRHENIEKSVRKALKKFPPKA